jgi:hypothetical protein
MTVPRLDAGLGVLYSAAIAVPELEEKAMSDETGGGICYEHDRRKEAEKYFIHRMGDIRWFYRGLAVTKRAGRYGKCKRCGRRPGRACQLHVLEDKDGRELLEYGRYCWRDSLLPALGAAIKRENDKARHRTMIFNYSLFINEGTPGQLWDTLKKEGAQPQGEITSASPK